MGDSREQHCYPGHLLPTVQQESWVLVGGGCPWPLGYPYCLASSVGHRKVVQSSLKLPCQRPCGKELGAGTSNRRGKRHVPPIQKEQPELEGKTRQLSSRNPSASLMEPFAPLLAQVICQKQHNNKHQMNAAFKQAH